MPSLRLAVCLSVAALLPAYVRAQTAPSTAPARAPIVPPKITEPAFPDKTISVLDFGATAKDQVNDTSAINKAIAAAHDAGGGTVRFPEGTYLAASIHLQSNVRLQLDDRAIITGAKDGFDPPEANTFDRYQDVGHSHFHNALMWGENLENVAITGGTINGGGVIATDPKPGGGDKVIAVRSGKNLQFTNIRHETGGHFVYLLNDCENITLANLTILRSRDGVDLMGCRNVLMHDCTFTGCGDDTLGIKSDYALGRKIKSENIYAWNCTFSTGCNAVQFGSETAGDFFNVKAWNIKVLRAAKAGIGITCNDGAIIDGIEFRDFTMTKASHPIFLLVTDRLRTADKDPKVGAIKNVTIANVTATDVIPGNRNSADAITLSGRPDGRLENITLENIRITYKGGGKREHADLVPPYNKAFPPALLGIRPASGLYARHVTNLRLRDIAFSFESDDFRPPLAFVDIDGLTMENVRSQKPADVEMMRLEKVSNLVVKNSAPLQDERTKAVDKAKR